MIVNSPKTEHHPGGESRVVPLFPELRPYLEEVFHSPQLGGEFVITRYRDTNANLRTPFERIITRAGIKPWLKPFQNLRSTRETEPAESFPMHVVCNWLGNTEPVAAKHYLQMTDEHFRVCHWLCQCLRSTSDLHSHWRSQWHTTCQSKMDGALLANDR